MAQTNKQSARVVVDRGNIESYIAEYLRVLSSLPDRIEAERPYELLLRLKRAPVGCGPYPRVSIFETANRVFSDLTILFGVRTLFSIGTTEGMTFPFNSYSIALGTTSGCDLRADDGSNHLRGEAFNVAATFYQTKRAQALKRLRSDLSSSTHRVVVFNRDALPAVSSYAAKTDDGIVFIPVSLDL